MKITIQNFKSIQDLQKFDLKPVTVLSGVNSTGKSSFIQLLLILKQTIELGSENIPFCIDGDYFKTIRAIDLLHNRNHEKEIEVEFEFSKEEFNHIKSQAISVFNVLGEYVCKISIQFALLEGSNRFNIKRFSVNFIYSEGKDQQVVVETPINQKHTISATNTVFGENLWSQDKIDAQVTYISIYPTFYTKEVKEDAVKHDGGHEIEYGLSKGFIHLDDVKSVLNEFFKRIYYIGPLREFPREEYVISNAHTSVGNQGEFTPQILSEQSLNPIDFFKIIDTDRGIQYQEATMTLIEFVDYWVCEIFQLARKISAQRTSDSYKVLLLNNSGESINIRHVGFGISQLLPIIVQGLILPKGGTMIIEQPEVHLHPKVQSLIFDFLYGVSLKNKTVLVETHSSHFITRMRRRVAEDQENSMTSKLNLTFIESDIFRTLHLDDYGTLDYFPKDFIEPSADEYNAIIQAQMEKRLKKS